MQEIGDNTTTPDTKPQKSKAAVASFSLGVFGLPLFPITAPLAIIFGIVALNKIKKRKGQLTGKWFAITGITLPPLIIAFVAILFSMDAPPIENDWSVADMRSAAPEYSDSYDLLVSLRDIDYFNTPTSAGSDSRTINRIKELSSSVLSGKTNSLDLISAKAQEHAIEIESIWTSLIEARQIIKTLSTYKEIADLTEQKYEPEDTFWAAYKQTAQLYWLHATIMCERGNTIESSNEIVEFDSVSRKLIMNSRTVISYLVAYATISKDIKIANFMINHAESSTESVEILAEHFKPLTENQTSLRNAAISEYLTFKNALETNSFEFWHRDTEYSVSEAKEDWLLRHNSTLRLYRNTLESFYQINEDSKPLPLWPLGVDGLGRNSIDFDNWDSEPMPDLYMTYNPDGAILTSIYMPALQKVIEVKTKYLVSDDLFQIVLAMRLGKKYDLTARAYGGEYIVDIDKEIIFSVGPDEEAYTDDDISLPINPEVLGLVGTKTKIQEIAALKARATDCWDKRKANIAKLKKLTQQREKMLFGGMVTSKGKRLFAETDVVLNEMIANGNEVVRCLTKLEEMGVDFSELECASYVEDKPLPAGMPMPGMPGMPKMPGMPSK